MWNKIPPALRAELACAFLLKTGHDDLVDEDGATLAPALAEVLADWQSGDERRRRKHHPEKVVRAEFAQWLIDNSAPAPSLDEFNGDSLLWIGHALAAVGRGPQAVRDALSHRGPFRS
jgi:phytoene/squalene synthetase